MTFVCKLAGHRYATAPNYGESILGVSKTWEVYE